MKVQELVKVQKSNISKVKKVYLEVHVKSKFVKLNGQESQKLKVSRKILEN
jgi:hypothetical protein